MATIKNRLAEAYLTCFGLGHAPLASGTFGTLGGVALAYGIALAAPENYLLLTLSAALVLALIGAPLGGWAEQKWGRKDPSQYVLDEVIGFLIAVALIDPQHQFQLHLILGFLLFRFFDIFKPPPARQLENIKGGWGIILDDVVAGVYAALALLIYTNYLA